jgi:hypothetical protein
MGCFDFQIHGGKEGRIDKRTNLETKVQRAHHHILKDQKQNDAVVVGTARRLGMVESKDEPCAWPRKGVDRFSEMRRPIPSRGRFRTLPKVVSRGHS